MGEYVGCLVGAIDGTLEQILPTEETVVIGQVEQVQRIVPV